MRTHTTYQARVSMTRSKHRRLDAAFAACARLYNSALEHWRTAYKTTSYWRGRDNATSPTLFDQNREYTAIRADDPEYGDMSVHIGRGVLARLSRARSAFFKRAKAGVKPGCPKFKSARRWRSIEIGQPSAGMVANKRGKTVVKIRGLPVMPVKTSRPLPDSKRLKRIIIVRKPNGVYVNLTYQTESEPMPETGEAVGVDMGVTARMSLSDGREYPRGENPDFADLQRRIANCRRGSNNQRKLYRQLARERRRESDHARDELHRITTAIIRANDFIAIEDLSIQNMTASASGTAEKPGRGVAAKSGLNRAILSQGWGMARAQLEYKATRYGRTLIVVDPKHTSQTCSVCGCVDRGARSGKRYSCAGCGSRMDADVNAARVILARGLEQHKTGGNTRRLRASVDRKIA